jgi:hypothetical protein
VSPPRAPTPPTGRARAATGLTFHSTARFPLELVLLTPCYSCPWCPCVLRCVPVRPRFSRPAAAAEQAADENPGLEIAPQKTKEELEAQQEEQLNALRVLYAAQHAVKHANESCGTAPCGGDPKPKFDELMKNITFPKSGGFLGGDGAARKKAIDSVPACGRQCLREEMLGGGNRAAGGQSRRGA